jgi:hypothetical protein
MSDLRCCTSPDGVVYVGVQDLLDFLLNEARQLAEWERESCDEIKRLRYRIKAQHVRDLHKRLSDLA